jgi:hypothetical protein
VPSGGFRLISLGGQPVRLDLTVDPGMLARVFGRLAAAAQLGLSMVLITGAMLFTFSLYRLTKFDTGVVRSGLTVMEDRAAAQLPPGAGAARGAFGVLALNLAAALDPMRARRTE